MADAGTTLIDVPRQGAWTRTMLLDIFLVLSESN